MAQRRPPPSEPAGDRGPRPLDADLSDLTEDDSGERPIAWSEPTQILRRRPLDAPKLVVVRVVLGAGPLQCWIATPSSSAVLGRAPDADLVVNDPSVSRYHARIDVDTGGRLTVADLGSTNGTLLNGRPVLKTLPVQPGDRVTVGGVGVAVESMTETEVDQMRRAASRLDAADRDPITGLFARRWLEDDLGAYVDRIKRSGRAATCLFLDLDGFKEVNDRNGHATGDAVLKQVGELVRSAIRDDDVAVRYGGDEFAVFLSGCDVTEGRRVAERLRIAVARLEVAPLGAGAVTLSIGVAQYEGEPAAAWIERADGALYRAKRGGRNQTATT